jgi:oxygen-independent coproporphyrinogen-3 oxidase
MTDAEILSVDPLFLAKYDRQVPRYTSYPTAPQFHPVDEAQYIETLLDFDRTDKPLSLYFHIPFCKSMCLFCGCSVVLNRQPERQERYFLRLLEEIERASGHFSSKRMVSQLHLGGGTPTSLTIQQFDRLMAHIRARFEFTEDAEIAIEVDPRTVYADKGEKLAHLSSLGFNRVSFGVQDLDPAVQDAVKRRQTEEMTVQTYFKARELGFQGINIDLIYGLPLQTAASFGKTAEKLIALRPDRIAFYSYAKVPWLKPHQKAIPDADLPSTEEKFRIYVEAREAFMKGGYLPIGMDHFALEGDSIASAYREKKLTRNFQGYSVQMAEDMLSFGITAIGFLQNRFFQNVKTLEEYEAKGSQGKLPSFRGFILSLEDMRRRYAIQALMCRFELDKADFSHRFGLSFDAHFQKELETLARLEGEGLVELGRDRIVATALGRLFIRIVASAFDAYLGNGQFSRAV